MSRMIDAVTAAEDYIAKEREACRRQGGAAGAAGEGIRYRADAARCCSEWRKARAGSIA